MTSLRELKSVEFLKLFFARLSVVYHLYSYDAMFFSVGKAADLTRPIEKKTYRGPSPTCHDFNQFTAKSNQLMLIIGFTLGQIQLVEPMQKEYNKLFNEEVPHLVICLFY